MARNVIRMHSHLAQHSESRGRHREQSGLGVFCKLQIFFAARDAHSRNGEAQSLIGRLENQPRRWIRFRKRLSHADEL